MLYDAISCYIQYIVEVFTGNHNLHDPGLGGHFTGDHLGGDHLQGRSGADHADPLLSRGAPRSLDAVALAVVHARKVSQSDQ